MSVILKYIYIYVIYIHKNINIYIYINLYKYTGKFQEAAGLPNQDCSVPSVRGSQEALEATV